MSLPALARFAPAALLLLWGALALFSHQPPVPIGLFLGLIAAAWLVFLLAWQHHSPSPRALWLWALALRAIAWTAEPIYEDDWARYLWDGHRFATDGTPYGQPPADFFADPTVTEPWQPILDQINHPHLPTVYGPTLQAYFLLCALLAPASLGGLKLGLLAADLLVLWLLTRHASVPRAAWFYALCPLVLFEVGFNAHADILGVAPLLAACLIAARSEKLDTRSALLTGLLLGVAAAAKPIALVAAPFLLFRGRTPFVLALVATLALAYLPFRLLGGATDQAGLTAMALAWEFNSLGFAVIQAALGPTLARPVAAVLGLGLAALVWLRWWRHGRTWPPRLDLVMFAGLLFAPVVNPWYLLWLTPWVALQPRAWTVTALAAVTLSYLTAQNLGLPHLPAFQHPRWVRPTEITLIALAAAYTWSRRPHPAPH